MVITDISSMELIIKHLEDDHAATIIMGIPWFEKTYAGDKAQNRLLRWSKKLYELCKKTMYFIDTYKMFCTNTDIWLMKKTPKRHYSVFATKVLGEELFQTIKDIIDKELL